IPSRCFTARSGSHSSSVLVPRNSAAYGSACMRCSFTRGRYRFAATRSPAASVCNVLRRMLEGKRVAVVVPAYNEELLIADTIAGIPPFVDRVYVVDDRSGDATAERARAVDDQRVEVIAHERN